MHSRAQSSTAARLNHRWLLLGILLVAAALRFWQLGAVPSGLYRDEAQNGIDALKVLDGNLRLWFPDNNGREPAYVYLTAAMIGLFGRNAWAVRAGAALVGTVSVLPVYGLAQSWFGRRAGLFAALLWAITLWPVHLSRVGFRAILVPPLLALIFWAGTVVYRRAEEGEIGRFSPFLLGLLIGGGIYTYLPARLLPLILILFLIYLRLFVPKRLDWRLGAAVVSGALVAMAPMIFALYSADALFGGRTGQVAVFNAQMSFGELLGTAWRQFSNTMGLFFYRGDTIWRHNVAGRPVFDPAMALFFIVGVGWSIVNWRRRAAALSLIWCAVMLLGTLLAEDAPHFLRAVGILPIVLIFAAVGLSQLWTWSKLPSDLRRIIVMIAVVLSFAISARDYFVVYGQQPDVAYLFEAAARELAESAESESNSVFVDRRFEEGWLSIPYLIDPNANVSIVDRSTMVKGPNIPFSWYVWPYEPYDEVVNGLTRPALISINSGPNARGDLEAEPYVHHVRIQAESAIETAPVANFNNQLQLLATTIESVANDEMLVTLTWAANGVPNLSLSAFVHVRNNGTVVGQMDNPAGGPYWRPAWWQDNHQAREQRLIIHEEESDDSSFEVVVGVYDTVTGDRLPVIAADGTIVGDSWTID